MKDREMILEVNSFDLLEERGEIIIFSHSVESFDKFELPEVPKNVKRRDLPIAAVRLRPLAMDKVEFTAVGKRKFHTLVSSKVVSLCARYLGWKIFAQFRRKAQNSSEKGPHKQRTEEKREIYEQLMEPVLRYLEKEDSDKKSPEKSVPEREHEKEHQEKTDTRTEVLDMSGVSPRNKKIVHKQKALPDKQKNGFTSTRSLIGPYLRMSIYLVCLKYIFYPFALQMSKEKNKNRGFRTQGIESCKSCPTDRHQYGALTHRWSQLESQR